MLRTTCMVKKWCYFFQMTSKNHFGFENRKQISNFVYIPRRVMFSFVLFINFYVENMWGNEPQI